MFLVICFRHPWALATSMHDLPPSCLRPYCQPSTALLVHPSKLRALNLSKLAAPGRLRASWAELEVGPGGKLGRNCSCRARQTLKLRMRTARAALAQINSVCSALHSISKNSVTDTMDFLNIFSYLYNLFSTRQCTYRVISWFTINTPCLVKIWFLAKRTMNTC
jgi:hypothetical protein